jgi:hypothetical protein
LSASQYAVLVDKTSKKEYAEIRISEFTRVIKRKEIGNEDLRHNQKCYDPLL